MSSATTLPSLLGSTGFLLSYALPLLFTSIVLTFAGTFLTLDRTRSFPRAYDAIVPGSFDKKPRAKDFYLLCGGVGGLASGLVFGIHFTTFLALLIPNVTPNSPLSNNAFLAVWLISTIVTTLLGGRWRYSAIVFSGLAGGCLFSLLLNIILHPSLTTRVVLTSIFTPLILLLTLLPFPIVQYPALRLANASLGGVGLVISIALLAHEPNWSNPWERYWIADGWGWASGKEKGLSAVACILLVFGIVSDWALRRKFGECPDEKWDSYLCKYSANLPDRAGVFRPARGFMDKFLHLGHGDEKKTDIIFPDEFNDDSTHLKQGFLSTAPPAYDLNDLERYPIPRAQPGFLKKAKYSQSTHSSQRSHSLHNGPKRKREAIKFQPLGDLSSDEDDEQDKPTSPTRPWLQRAQPSSASSATSGRTLVNQDKLPSAAAANVEYDRDLEPPKTKKKGFGEKDVPDYSDGEDTATRSSSSRKISGSSSAAGEGGWTPKFMQDCKAGGSRTCSGGVKPVPATPSLIKAIDRVQAAQREAYGGQQPHETEGLPSVVEERDVVEAAAVEKEEQQIEEPVKAQAGGGRWTSFWREVERKNRASSVAAESVRRIS